MTRQQNTKKPVLSSESLFRNGLRVFLLLVLLLGIVLAVDWVYRVDNFPVQNIRMQGQFKLVQRQELSNAVMGAVQGNIFALDIDAIRKKAEALPWIYRAEVRRSWPDEIHIRFVEQKLMGRWNSTAWVNTASEVVRIDNAAEYYSNLPLLSGQGLSRQPAGRTVADAGDFDIFLAIGQLRQGATEFLFDVFGVLHRGT